MIRAKKQLGQHFLTSKKIAHTIATTATAPSEVLRIEIGPGTGILTEALLQEGFRVLAIEKDAELIPLLHERFAEALQKGKLLMQQQDVLTFTPPPEPYVVVANIPYYITGAILRHFLEQERQPIEMVLLLQHEVAQQLCAQPGEHSLLSISVQIYGQVRIVQKVPARFFKPAPKVDSAIIHIGAIANPFQNESQKQRFFKLLKAGFAHKRKKLISNIASFADAEKRHRAFQELGLSENTRAQELSPEQWFALAEALTENSPS